MKHIIDPMDLSVDDVDRLLNLADNISLRPEKYREVCRYKKLATLFLNQVPGRGSVLKRPCWS